MSTKPLQLVPTIDGLEEVRRLQAQSAEISAGLYQALLADLQRVQARCVELEVLPTLAPGVREMLRTVGGELHKGIAGLDGVATRLGKVTL